MTFFFFFRRNTIDFFTINIYIFSLCGATMYIGSVGSQFVADRNSVGFARKTSLTISFVERGFERLGLDR